MWRTFQRSKKNDGDMFAGTVSTGESMEMHSLLPENQTPFRVASTIESGFDTEMQRYDDDACQTPRHGSSAASFNDEETFNDEEIVQGFDFDAVHSPLPENQTPSRVASTIESGFDTEMQRYDDNACQTPRHGSLAASFNDEETFNDEEIVQGFDFDAVQSSYSPEKDRDCRSWVMGNRKVHLGDKLTGGDFIISKTTGVAVTISFFFQGPNEDIYGLTSGHSTSLHDPLFIFTGDTLGLDGEYPMKEIGIAVEVLYETDSCIFKVHPGIPVRLNTIRVAPGRLHTIDLSMVPRHLIPGTEVCLFGAMRREMSGNITGSTEVYMRNLTGHVSVLRGDVKIEGKENKPLTHDGDCGAIAIDRHGHCLALHHCLQVIPHRGLFGGMLEGLIGCVLRRPFFLKERHFISFAVPLAKIMDAHHSYFQRTANTEHLNPELQSPVSHQSAIFTKNLKVFWGCRAVRKRIDFDFGEPGHRLRRKWFSWGPV